jgi:hypothetical protein
MSRLKLLQEVERKKRRTSRRTKREELEEKGCTNIRAATPPPNRGIFSWLREGPVKYSSRKRSFPFRKVLETVLLVLNIFKRR